VPTAQNGTESAWPVRTATCTRAASAAAARCLVVICPRCWTGERSHAGCARRLPAGARSGEPPGKPSAHGGKIPQHARHDRLSPYQIRLLTEPILRYCLTLIPTEPHRSSLDRMHRGQDHYDVDDPGPRRVGAVVAEGVHADPGAASSLGDGYALRRDLPSRPRSGSGLDFENALNRTVAVMRASAWAQAADDRRGGFVRGTAARW
jgi:hypothetical protein